MFLFLGKQKKKARAAAQEKTPARSAETNELRVAHKKELEIIEKGKSVHQSPFGRLRVTPGGIAKR